MAGGSYCDNSIANSICGYYSDYNPVYKLPTHGISTTWFIIMASGLALLLVLGFVSWRKLWHGTACAVSIISFGTFLVFGLVTLNNHLDGGMYSFTRFYHWAPWLAVAFLVNTLISMAIADDVEEELDELERQELAEQDEQDYLYRLEQQKLRPAPKSRRAPRVVVLQNGTSAMGYFIKS